MGFVSENQSADAGERSYQAWAEALLKKQNRLALLDPAQGFMAEEIVAVELELVDVDGKAAVRWFPLRNVAAVDSRSTRFVTDGAEFYNLLDTLHYRFADVHCLSLWHSHYVNAEPSDTDVEFFPEDVFAVGKIYHTPTARTILYNSSGVLSTP